MARKFRGRAESEDGSDGSDERSQGRWKSRKRRHDFSSLRETEGGASRVVFFLVGLAAVAMLVGLLLFTLLRPTRQTKPTVWATEGHGERFEAIVEETAQTLYAQWRNERGRMSAGEESALLTEARAKARRTCTFLVRSMKIGKDLGASDEVREAVYQKLAPIAEDGGDVRDDHIRAVYAALMGR